MKTFQSSRPWDGSDAFSRLDVCACLAGLALLGLLALPALAMNRTRSERFVCLNNLRQLGIGLQLWGDEHGDLPPFEVAVNMGGTRGHALSPNVWYHLAWLSNGVTTPNIFFCPSDTGSPARDFSNSPTTGYLHPNFANRATSYFLAHPWDNIGGAVIAGDRNLRFSFEGINPGCWRFNSAFSASVPESSASWTGGLHGPETGNFLRLDGGAGMTDSAGMRAALHTSRLDVGSFHFIRPR